MAVSSHITLFGGTRRFAAALTTFLTLGVGYAKADNFAYISDVSAQNIMAWDLTNPAAPLTPVLTSIGGANATIDSLVFSGNSIIYSILGSNELGIFSCPGGYSSTNGTCMGASTNAVLAAIPGASAPADLALDPSGTSVWVSDTGTKTISQVSLTGTVLKTLNLNNMRADGLAFAGGNLYAVLQTSGPGEELAQINTSGAGSISNFIVLPGENGLASMADGLTWDPTTGSFYVASDAGGVYQVPLALTSQTYTQLLPSPGVFPGNEFDGITSFLDTLYIVNRDVGGATYNLNATTGAVIPGAVVVSPLDSSADDIAAVVGSPFTMTPEPSTSVLAAAGFFLAAIGLASRRKNVKA